MATMKRQYPAIIEKEPGSAYGITFPDFPGCVSAGPNAEAALLNAAEALAGPVALMFVASEPLPDPTPFEADEGHRAHCRRLTRDLLIEPMTLST